MWGTDFVPGFRCKGDLEASGNARCETLESRPCGRCCGTMSEHRYCNKMLSDDVVRTSKFVCVWYCQKIWLWYRSDRIWQVDACKVVYDDVDSKGTHPSNVFWWYDLIATIDLSSVKNGCVCAANRYLSAVWPQLPPSSKLGKLGFIFCGLVDYLMLIWRSPNIFIAVTWRTSFIGG